MIKMESESESKSTTDSESESERESCEYVTEMKKKYEITAWKDGATEVRFGSNENDVKCVPNVSFLC